MSDLRFRLMSSAALVSSAAEDLLDIQIRMHVFLLKVAELDRRGAAHELGYKNLPQVIRHIGRVDVKVARQWVKHARLISPEVTPTGAELEPELPATAEAMAEGALSPDHLAATADVMVKEELPGAAEKPLVDFARQHEPSAVRSFGKELAYRLKQNDPEPRDEEPKPPVNRLVARWERRRYKAGSIWTPRRGRSWKRHSIRWPNPVRPGRRAPIHGRGPSVTGTPWPSWWI